MRKVTVILRGTLTYSAQRTLELEVSEDADLSTIAPETLNELADSLRIPWEYGEFGYLDAQEFSIDATHLIGSDDRKTK